MGAVRNLFVRIGGDASGAVKSFKDASSAGANAQKSIKKSSAQTKKSIREAFASSVPSIKEYSAQITQIKNAHNTAAQNVSRLEDQVAVLSRRYEAVKSVASGLDMSASIKKQVADTENLIESLGKKIEETKEKINFVKEVEPSGMEHSLKPLQLELQGLIEKSDNAVSKLVELERIEQMMGNASSAKTLSAGLLEMENELVAVQNDLKTTKMVADEAGKKLKSMGVGPYLKQAIKGIGTAAAQAAGTGIKKLWSGLKGLAGAAGRGLAALPGKLRNIGSSAANSIGGLTKLVRSIRNIGIASLGMRVAKGMFGQMRSIISNYVSQNEELNNSISSLKNQMGEALAPAINIVVAALQRIMPVVTAVSNGINSIFKALFGDIAATSKKMESAVEELNTYGFDQITKESDSDAASDSSATTQEGEQSAFVTKLTGWLTKLKTAFMAGDWKTLGGTFAEGINSVFSALGNSQIGSKIGGALNAVSTTLHSLLTGIDFRGIGAVFGQQMTDTFSAIDWNTVGQVVGQLFVMLPSLITGWIAGTDWGVVGASLSSFLASALNEITVWIQETDWLQLGESIATFIASIDWGGIISSLASGLGAALGGLAALCWGLIKDAWAQVVAWWKETAYEDGQFTIDGLLRGIGDVIANIGAWIKKNIFDPFINGFCAVFKIHSPSVVMQEKGGFLISGLLGGITAAWDKITAFFNTALSALSNKISDAFTKLKTTVSNIWQNGILPAIKGPINSIISCINKMISGIVSGINAAINALNKLSIDIPDWVPVIGGKKFGFNIPTLTAPQIPMLEKGGVLQKGQVGLLEGKGDEAVVPLERNTEWLDVLATKLTAKISGNNGGGSATFQFYLGNRKITEYVVKDINQITKENGVCPIHV